jgi:hypothetical protein
MADARRRGSYRPGQVRAWPALHHPRPLPLPDACPNGPAHRPFLGIPTTDPLARLARVSADGTLSPIAAGSLAQSPRLYAFVHGWAPGAPRPPVT